jgi:hypothetical protein
MGNQLRRLLYVASFAAVVLLMPALRGAVAEGLNAESLGPLGDRLASVLRLLREEVRVSKRRKTENTAQTVTLRREVVDLERIEADTADPEPQ